MIKNTIKIESKNGQYGKVQLEKMSRHSFNSTTMRTLRIVDDNYPIIESNLSTAPGNFEHISITLKFNLNDRIIISSLKYDDNTYTFNGAVIGENIPEEFIKSNYSTSISSEAYDAIGLILQNISNPDEECNNDIVLKSLLDINEPSITAFITKASNYTLSLKKTI